MIKEIIAGLQVLLLYYKNPDAYNVSAEYEEFFTYATDTPLSDEDVLLMISLGWRQDCDEEEFSLGSYDQEERWTYYT